jgi:transcription factor C subunit 3
MVYSSLQIITRGREKGVTVVELGQRSKYDQKACFYLVKQLVDLNLMCVSFLGYFIILNTFCFSVKVRRGGVGTHFCLHRYFFDRDPSWKNIREEESNAELRSTKQEESGDEASVIHDGHTGAADPEFTLIDARHLSSLPLIRARVVKLLKRSQNHMHQSANMLLALVSETVIGRPILSVGAGLLKSE